MGYRKFTDQELISLWSCGHSDTYIANQLKVCQATVWERRVRLGLEAHRPNQSGKKMSLAEMQQAKVKSEEKLKELQEQAKEIQRTSEYYKERHEKNIDTYGKEHLNKRARQSYKIRNQNSDLSCSECGSKISIKCNSGLCISCTQKKFTDQELISLWRMGLNDYKIAERFGVHASAVCRRRKKLRLQSIKEISAREISINISFIPQKQEAMLCHV